MNGYTKTLSRISAALKIQNDDKYCFIWSTLAYFHPIADSGNGHLTRVSNYRQDCNESNLQVFKFLISQMDLSAVMIINLRN